MSLSPPPPRLRDAGRRACGTSPTTCAATSAAPRRRPHRRTRRRAPTTPELDGAAGRRPSLLRASSELDDEPRLRAIAAARRPRERLVERLGRASAPGGRRAHRAARGRDAWATREGCELDDALHALLLLTIAVTSPTRARASTWSPTWCAPCERGGAAASGSGAPSKRRAASWCASCCSSSRTTCAARRARAARRAPRAHGAVGVSRV